MKVLKWIMNIDNFKAILRHKKLSQKELAKQLGIHPMTISAWCSGKSQPTDKLLDELIIFLDVPEDKLKISLPTAEQQLALLTDTAKNELPDAKQEAESKEDDLREMIKMALQLLSLINDYQMLRRQSTKIQEDSLTNHILTNAKIRLLEHIRELEEQNLKK